MTADTPDMANALIRETHRGKKLHPTLAMLPRQPIAIRSAVSKAKRFMLDDAMSKFLADLSIVPFKVAMERQPDIIDSLRHSSRLPFPKMFIQYSNLAFRRRMMEIIESKADAYGEPFADPDSGEVVDYEAMLLEQDERDDNLVWAQWFVNDNGHTLPLPWTYAYRTDDQDFDPRLGIDTLAGMFAHGVTPYHCHGVGVRYAKPLDKFEPRALVKVETPFGNFKAHRLLVEFSGAMRYALALLATLNDIPKTETEVRPQKSYMGGGQIRKYLDFTTLRLALPAKAIHTNVAKRLIAAARRGWHEVRPHWRIYHHGEHFCRSRADHLWLATDDSKRARCKLCDAWRVWIELPHGRGDPTISIRTHRYALTHPENAK